ncbi:gamma-glutamylcyclotransferase [Neolewinella aurantiaca]|uniref:Gamma-glutamylcyclotransferase n=1 Tax=Neolewinella aurantiaca TaxID=2602767 RepID=A0A5C7FIW1_9BACT|nr:gamma-glutamylcyclotransferase family protein [Neolewinella aurantiaca]TXF91181.1 gamma-glutamylcyclotransferase [Neolewinella aurantiaca]
MHLFVYGSLLSNIPSSMSKFLRRRATLIGKATTPGSLYDLGMYPGFVPGGEELVKGELYHINPESEALTMEMLDAYESVTGEPEDEYSRVEIAVQVSGGGTFKAETYVFMGETEGKQLIPKGDYPAYYVGNADHGRFVNGE